MILVAGFLLGMAGSVHCVAMCGPLLVALHGRGGIAGGMGASWWRGVAVHHTGRLLSYGLLGAGAGLAGAGIVVGGFGRALSVTAGLVVIVMAVARVFPADRGVALSVGAWVGRALVATRARTTRSGLSAAAVVGVLNGVLPCGLVYGALAAAVALGEPLASATFMTLFGLGTSPLLLVVTRSLGHVRPFGLVRLRYAGPVALALVGLLLMWRGIAPFPAHAHAHETAVLDQGTGR